MMTSERINSPLVLNYFWPSASAQKERQSPPCLKEHLHFVCSQSIILSQVLDTDIFPANCHLHRLDGPSVTLKGIYNDLLYSGYKLNHAIQNK
ncbi:uncharacterized protein J3R85_014834 [Psidium guajava]|nr:uncharacterized protein J3R85_014834 [Psidium guajava]